MTAITCIHAYICKQPLTAAELWKAESSFTSLWGRGGAGGGLSKPKEGG